MECRRLHSFYGPQTHIITGAYVSVLSSVSTTSHTAEGRNEHDQIQTPHVEVASVIQPISDSNLNSSASTFQALVSGLMTIATDPDTSNPNDRRVNQHTISDLTKNLRARFSIPRPRPPAENPRLQISVSKTALTLPKNRRSNQHSIFEKIASRDRHQF